MAVAQFSLDSVTTLSLGKPPEVWFFERPSHPYPHPHLRHMPLANHAAHWCYSARRQVVEDSHLKNTMLHGTNLSITRVSLCLKRQSMTNV